MGNSLVVHKVKFAHAEGCGDLILHDPDPGAIARDFGTALDLTDSANVEAHRRVELQRTTSGGRLRIAEHHSDLLAQLVDEHHDAMRSADTAGELAQRL